MSGEAAAAALPPAWVGSVHNRRVLRYALGVTLAMTVSGAAAWDLAFICPVLAGLLLSLPVPLTLRGGLGFVLMMAIAMGLSFVFGVLLIPYPLVLLGLLAVVLFRIFYAAAGNAQPFFILWLVIGFSTTPLITMISSHAGWIMTVSFVLSAAVAVMTVFIVQTFLPDSPRPAAVAPAPRPVPERSARIRSAAISTLTVWPLLALFFAMQWTSYVDVTIYAAVLAISADLKAGFKSGLAIIVANIGGALITFVMFNLLVALPQLWFFALLTLLVTLFMGQRKFSDAPTAALYSTALSGILIIIGESTGYTMLAGTKITTRMFQIIMAVVYIVVMFGLLESLWKRRQG